MSNYPLVRLTAALSRLAGVGPATALDVLRRLNSHPQTGAELADVLCSVNGTLKRPITATGADLALAFSAADQMLEKCNQAGILVTVAGSLPFWEGVWKIPKPPLMLFYRGCSPDSAAQHAVAIIGTREPSGFGSLCAHKIAKQCTNRHLTVVSGLAIGCDSAAHEGAIEGGGFTIAVLAHGLHTVYPAKNRNLAEKIIDSGGLLVSEYPPGVELRPNQLVERDRIQAALSRGLIVIETDIKGGTMHTVKFAQEQGRFVACVNHKPEMRDEPKSRGNQKLIRDGTALPLGTSDDLQAYIDQIKGIEKKAEYRPVEVQGELFS